MNIDSINALLHLYNANIHRNVFSIISLSSAFHHFLPMTMSENLFNQGRFFLIQDINPCGKIINLTFLIRPASKLFRIFNEKKSSMFSITCQSFRQFPVLWHLWQILKLRNISLYPRNQLYDIY